MKPMRRILLSVAVLGVLVGTACGGGDQVGSGVSVVPEDGGTVPRLGETTTTSAPAAAETTAPPAVQATTTAPPPTAPPTTQQRVALTIRIADRSTYEPLIGQVSNGALVRWVNEDTIERQVAATDNAFVSPKIPPGGSWDWKATVPGRHDYSDPDVPFAAGARLEVSR